MKLSELKPELEKIGQSVQQSDFPGGTTQHRLVGLIAVLRSHPRHTLVRSLPIGECFYRLERAERKLGEFLLSLSLAIEAAGGKCGPTAVEMPEKAHYKKVVCSSCGEKVEVKDDAAVVCCPRCSKPIILITKEQAAKEIAEPPKQPKPKVPPLSAGDVKKHEKAVLAMLKGGSKDSVEIKKALGIDPKNNLKLLRSMEERLLIKSHLPEKRKACQPASWRLAKSGK